MKYIAIIVLSLLTAAGAAHATDAPAAAAPELPAPPPPAAPTATTNIVPPSAPMPAPAPAIQMAKKVELMDGSWALVDGDSVKISTDNGKTWDPAPDQTWVAKDGSKLATKRGKIDR